MLFVVYVLCMFALYSFMPIVMEMTSATAVNLALLTADLFSLFCGLFLFRYTVSDSPAILVSLTPLDYLAFLLLSKCWLGFSQKKQNRPSLLMEIPIQLELKVY